MADDPALAALTEALRSLDDVAETDRIWRVMGEGVLAERLLAALRAAGWTVAPEQVVADGEALRRLREVLPRGYRLMLTYPLATREHPDWCYSVSVRKDNDYLGYIADGQGPTIAAAATAAREALP